MKRIFTLLLFFATFAGVANAQVNDGLTTTPYWTFKGLRVDSMKYENYYVQSERYIYDEAGRIIKKYTVSNDETLDKSGSFVRVLREYLREKEYNESGQLLGILCKIRNVGDDTWKYLFINTYEYGADGRLSSIIKEDATSIVKDTYTYDDQNNKETRTHYYGDDSDVLQKMYVVDDMYDDNHILMSKDSCVVNGEETVYYRRHYDYDSEARVVGDTTFVKKDAGWEYVQLNEYTYGDFGSHVKTVYDYKDGAWIKSEDYILSLDENHNYTEQTSYDWNNSSLFANTVFQSKYTYNTDGNPLTIEHVEYYSFYGRLIYDVNEKFELNYEDGKVIQNIYRKNNEEWTPSYSIVYYVTKLDDPTSVQKIQDGGMASDTRKTLVNGKLVIMKNGNVYNAAGQRMK